MVKAIGVLSDDYARSEKWPRKHSFVRKIKHKLPFIVKFCRKTRYLTREFHVKFQANEPGNGAVQFKCARKIWPLLELIAKIS